MNGQPVPNRAAHPNRQIPYSPVASGELRADMAAKAFSREFGRHQSEFGPGAHTAADFDASMARVRSAARDMSITEDERGRDVILPKPTPGPRSSMDALGIVGEGKMGAGIPDLPRGRRGMAKKMRKGRAK